MLIDSLKALYQKNKSANFAYLRNLFKEQIQYYLLQFVSQSVWAEELIFKGGTCLHVFFDLPRLSEDLDFDFAGQGDFDIAAFSEALRDYFVVNLKLEFVSFKIAGNKRTVYVKFPILDLVGLAVTPAESNILFVRVDAAPAVGKSFQVQLSVKSISQFSFITKHYTLPNLFAGKIAAILTRETIEEGVKIARTKGRDYYDLIWFLEKGVIPNWDYLEELTGIKKGQVLKQLKDKLQAVNINRLYEDIAPLFSDSTFSKVFAKNFVKLSTTYLAKLG